MTGAINDGLSIPNANPSSVSGICPTGNCTWDIYQSMGVCSITSDVSSTITSQCRNRGSQFNPAGCNYSISDIDQHPTALATPFQASAGDTLWIGASKIIGTQYKYPKINTLIEFYVIFIPNLATNAFNNDAVDHKSDLVALKVNLDLCLYTYNSSMTFGITDTNEIGRSTDLNWQTGTASAGTTGLTTVAITQDSQEFWMDQANVFAFNNYLSLQTFIGTAQMQNENTSDTKNNFKSDAAQAIASSLYGNPRGQQGLEQLLNNLAISMTNT